MQYPTVTFEVMSGPHLGERLKFDAHDTFLVGRSQTAQLMLPEDRHFSRNHFRIEVKPPQCHLVDLDSSNGTFVNGERVSDVWLSDGDTISGGRTEILVRIQNGSGNIEMETAEYDHFDPALAMTMVPEALALPGNVLHYDIVCELGKGSMGVVYRAHCRKTNQDVALKLISPTVRVDDRALKTFVREGQILRKLNHKRIVRFIETGVCNRSLFLAMEYVPTIDFGSTLSKLDLADRVRVSCGLMRQVLDGLAHAHKLNLIHRDVKPKNLLVSREGGRLHAKLADFGLAKNYMDAGLSQISGENEIKGTLNFMAPEQVINCRHAKPQADVFSAGATLYSLITGENIYDLSDHRTPLAAVLNDGPIPIASRVDIAPDLAAVIAKALASDVADRYQSANEMRDALKPFV